MNNFESQIEIEVDYISYRKNFSWIKVFIYARINDQTHETLIKLGKGKYDDRFKCISYMLDENTILLLKWGYKKMSNPYRRPKLSAKQLREYYQNGKLTFKDGYQPKKSKATMDHSGYTTVTYKVKIDKQKRGEKPLKRERALDKDINIVLRKHTTQRLQSEKRKPRLIQCFFQIRIGRNFGTADSNALDQYTVDDRKAGIVSVDDFLKEHEHKLPLDMGDYDGTIKYICVADHDYKEPISTFFRQYNQLTEEWETPGRFQDRNIEK